MTEDHRLSRASIEMINTLSVKSTLLASKVVSILKTLVESEKRVSYLQGKLDLLKEQK